MREVMGISPSSIKEGLEDHARVLTMWEEPRLWGFA